MKWNLQKILYRIFQAVLGIVIRLLKFTVPVLSTGPGSVLELPALIQEKGLHDLLLVTDRASQPQVLSFSWPTQELIREKQTLRP